MNNVGSTPRVLGVGEAAPRDRFDVVVVGSGAAGLSAALAAQAEGVETIVVERAAILGGTTRKSSGWAWYPNNSWMRAAGVVDHKEDALRYMARVAAAEEYSPGQPRLGLSEWQYAMLDAFYDEAAGAADALIDAGVHLRQNNEFPDYFSELSEDKTPFGRVVTPAEPDGEPAIGGEMIDQMAAVFEAGGGVIRREHHVESVVIAADGAVVGIAGTTGGARFEIGARRGVVFGSGGFGQNPELRRELLAMPSFGSCAAQTNTGDFLEIATGLGLPLRGVAYPWMTPMVLERALLNPPNVHSMFHAPGDSMIWVNRHGERRLNEKAPYNEIVRDLMRWDGHRHEYADLVQVMIWDADCQRIHAGDQRFNPMRTPGDDDAHVTSAPDLERLAEQVDMRLEAITAEVGGVRLAPGFASRLRESIERFNAGAANGVDPDFHRGETRIERMFNTWFGEPRRDDNPLVHPISAEGPYYATLVAPGMLDTKGGPRTNTAAEVLDLDGEPVPGLYGAGNCVASLSGRSYWGAGATIGPAVTFGRIAGRNAALAPVREPSAAIA